MTISIAEYWGQTADPKRSDILPLDRRTSDGYICPFSGNSCRRLAAQPAQHPVCSLYVHQEDGTTTFHDVCPDRLLPEATNGIWPPNVRTLASIAQTVFPGVLNKDIGYRRQVGITLNPGRLFLDYVLHVDPVSGYTGGPERVILEVQGGGETSNTGTITRYVDDWTQQNPPTNAFLAQPLNTKNLRSHLRATKVNVPGIIPNNAWKRQLDQILKKAVIANHFNGAFALVCGEVLYDYIRRSVPVGGAFFPQWEVALIGVSEAPAQQPILSGSPLAITQVTKSVFMTFADFLAALQGFQVPATLNDPFAGSFDTLTNQKFIVR